MESKIVEVGPHVVAKFLKAVDQMDALVGGTLGPAGRNRIIYRKYKSPLVTNDGVTIARHAYLNDEIEDLAAQTLVEIAMKTNDTAGDGTTTSVVIASELIRSCMKNVPTADDAVLASSTSINVMQMSREINKQLPQALKLLDAQKVERSDDFLDDVISTSLENLEYGKTLGQLLRDVGKDGYISIEDNWATKYGIETETTKGMRFLGTYATPYLVSREGQKDAMWENTLVLVTNQRIDTLTVLGPLFEEMKKAGKTRLVIIGGHSENTNPYSKEVITSIARSMEAAAKGTEVIQILAVKAPTLVSPELEDTAVFCDAKFIDMKLGMELKDVRLVHLGSAKSVVVNEDDVNIIGGAGNTKQRIEVLKQQIEIEKDSMFKEKLLRRIASLSAGVGIIRVGAPTEQERTYLKYKLEDAVNAAKAAQEEGIVPGGGKALMEVAETLGHDNILYSALCAPYKRICENAGVLQMEVGPEIVDPHKVVRLAFINACSAAGQLITCDGALAVHRQTLFDMWEKKMVTRDDHNDFRDDENQDMGRGRQVN